MRTIGGLGRVLGVDVEVLHHDGLTEGGLVVDPTAAISVSAGSDFKVETAVDLVLLRPEYGGQVLGHGDHGKELVGGAMVVWWGPMAGRGLGCIVINNRN